VQLAHTIKQVFVNKITAYCVQHNNWIVSTTGWNAYLFISAESYYSHQCK